MANDHQYIGSEFHLFALASNWKAYIRREIGPYVKGHVLEVGAGIGEKTKALITGRERSWTCLEPDRELAERLALTIKNNSSKLNLIPKVIVGSIDHPDCNRKYDTILYIDVLEHIENDELEMNKAVQKLSPQGYLIVLAPAHQSFYSPFDARIGHFRRYKQKRLLSIRPVDTNMLKIRYLDSVGCLASLANKLFLRSDLPTARQIIAWDRLLVPLSRLFDSLLGHKIGKSIFTVWQKK
jgi:SAM-dependent methyltransferase